ncbi:sulfatase family protein [Planctomicrobium piriforme]|uniref:Arylsulfatase A n=1 Tax=Planctomicrobium piriforme TaxID=1576369 RepID=A0A1I3HS81_9PLAN|nr:sulfatase [Planctomicrobium piriforme]SFI38636.1 Arylsulfatase A [Planctomicrobium piriforme]
MSPKPGRLFRPVMFLLLLLVSGRIGLAEETRPNIVILFADDQGYADVGCFGAMGFQTPQLDKMASEGMKLTNFYVSQAVCGASRASLLTGCYANRIGMLGAPGPTSTHGINKNEVLISELCKSRGYATAMYGKWHLGHHQPFLPLQHGFDEYFGLPYSNDMWPFHPEIKKFPPLPLLGGNEVVNANVTSNEQIQLTTWYTERAVNFIQSHREQPFFLYVAYAMPHVPLHVSEKFSGKSERGLYGDVIMEIDWSVGEILKTLDETDASRKTLVVYTSDNGPWLSYGNHAGSAGPLREGKGTSWEGGVREPCIVRWPGRVPAGAVCEEVAATIDLLPTIAGLIGAPLPEHPIDGKDIWPLLSDVADAKSPHEYYLFYYDERLEAIRSGDWKLHFPHNYRSLTGEPGSDGRPGGYSQQHTDLALYNLKDDIGEQRNVAADYPEIVERLQSHADAAREELGDSAFKKTGRGYRPPGQLEKPNVK